MFLGNLDLHTMIGLVSVGNLIVLILLLAYWGRQPRSRAFKHFVLGRFLQSIGWLLILYRGQIPDIMSAQFGNILLMFGVASESIAYLTYRGNSKNLERYFLSMAGLGAVIFFMFIRTPTQIRGFGALIALALNISLVAMLLRDWKQSVVIRVLGLLLCTVTASLAYRSVAAFQGLFNEPSLVPALQASFLLPVFAQLLAGSTAMLLLLKEKDERELRIAYNKYDLLFRSTPAAVFLSEPATGVVHEANPRCTDLTGYTPVELIGHSFSEFGLWAPGERERAEKAYCSQGNLHNFEMDAYNRAGQRRVWEISSAKAPLDDHMFIASSIQDITERKELQARVNQLLHEKEVLLREVHHRVRNNLSQIISLLSLQARTAGDQTAGRVLNDAGTRVQSMLALYDRIYTERIYTAVSAPDFFLRLVELLRSVFPDTSKITIELDIHELSIDPTIMSPLGQLINELFTNSMKHAFGNQNDGTIRIALHQEGDSLLLQYSDDGCGFSPEPADETGKSFGYILIEALAQQLEAEWQLEGPPGTRYSFRFQHVL